MLNIQLICVGKMKEKHYVSALNEYEKRLVPYCKLETIELSEERLPNEPTEALVAAALKREAAEIRRVLSPGAFILALCVEGNSLSSPELAALFCDCAGRGFSRLSFVIGSSNGLDAELKKAANLRLSMSKMTFPHHLARVMLAEQIYRGIMINEGTKYHK